MSCEAGSNVQLGCCTLPPVFYTGCNLTRVFSSREAGEPDKKHKNLFRSVRILSPVVLVIEIE